MGMKCVLRPWHYCVRNGEKEGMQNEMCSVSEMVRVWRKNPCASCGASPYFGFLPDFSLVALPDLCFMVSRFHSLCICSLMTTVFSFPSLPFHRQLK